MSAAAPQSFGGDEHDCYYLTDPRQNPELASALAGQNVVIAGAGRGIGQACANLLAHASPRSLTLVSLELDEVDNTAESCRRIKPDLLIKTAAFDVCDAERVSQLMTEVDRDFGGVDVLLMNAGRPPQWLPTAESDPKLWWDTVAVSVQGAFNFSRYALPTMQRKRGGRIIFTASDGAHRNVGMASYIIAKLGMVRLCEILHQENFKEFDIKVFSIHPGCVRTRFMTDFEDFLNEKPREGSYLHNDVPGERQSAEIATKTLTGVTFDTPELAAGLVVTLASGKLDFMSGRYVDSTRNIAKYMAERESILAEDLHRVKLHLGQGVFMPTSDF
ncbi:hypothetical protein EDB80DRAFT_634005 [Ilyonectria destructans]|nr:hypothetical protein EDB80DRAFT_634005 [Ilyonectria destructans]